MGHGTRDAGRASTASGRRYLTPAVSPPRAPRPSSRAPRPLSRVAIYAGTFDPITRGHEDIMARSLEFVDRLVVAVATNVAKQPLFSVDERVALVRAAMAEHPQL